MSYAPYGPRIAEARTKPALWRLLAGLALALIVSLALSQALLFGAVRIGGEELLPGIIGGTTPAGLILVLSGMGTLTLGTLAATHLLHGRGLRTLIGPYGLALRQAGRVFGALVVLQALLLGLMSWGFEGALIQQRALGIWLALLPLGLLAVLIQTSAEEILFRGYIQGQLAARFSHPALWILPQAALFAAGHYTAGTFGSNALGIALWAGVFGLIAGDLTARSGTLGPAMALHFVNNAMVILVISMDGMLSGLSLYTLPFSPGDETEVARAMPLEFGGLLVSWLAARVALRR
ncbi:CPBP family intramembrane metalloprotease [Roseivivax sp. GX 12232]|uniref:CPBP family intramembrane glutamic endopeptidase n=1 Tax=Roseivivax sp. GX 12232 TaxID=2900547 RepID=UPI001E645F8C|nr:type II CAAX endopeptidase family protein [Roseivivax sp. GX 12232]MCE0506946.1 CPBP family intramembrane metalloprotease [Roseivivax sp. GX 12232]